MQRDHATLEDLRIELLGSDAASARAVFRTVLARASAPVTALAAVAMALRDEPGHDLDAVEVADLDSLTATTVGRSLSFRIDEILARDAQADRFDAMIQWAWPHIGVRRVAVASSFPATAELAARRLEAQFGADRVVRLLSTMSAAARAKAGRKFLDDASRSIVVIDRGSEEGLNLQIVEDVLHLDLPLSHARLEQRIGRFDRWAPRGFTVNPPLRSSVFREADDRLDSHFGAWRRTLDEGVDIFGQSSATLQYVLPDLEDEFIDLALDSGLPVAAERLATRRADLEAQRRKIEGQDLLDTIEDRAEDKQLADNMRGADGSPRILSKFRGYVVKTLQLTEDVARAGTRFGISSKRPPRLTESQVERIGPEHLARRYSERRAASGGGVGLLRWGEPLVDRFVDLTSMDDRGRAFAVEVCQPRRDPNSVLTFFMFTLIITPDRAPIEDLNAKDSAAGAAATTRLGQLFPPRLETVWWHPVRGEVEEHVRQALATGSGYNLGADPERFHELTYGLDWPQLCERAATEAMRLAAQRPSVQAAASAALAAARDMRAFEEAVLQARHHAEVEPSLNIAALDAVVAAAQVPRLNIDACGVVFITGPAA